MKQELEVNVWDWVVLKNGKVIQIDHDDMMGVKHEDIARHATNEEIIKAGGDPKEYKLTSMSEKIHAQFQPTEKTREGLEKIIEQAHTLWTFDESEDKSVEGAIADALIQSGYIQGKGINLEPYPQTENTNTPTLQSDSVDAISETDCKEMIGEIIIDLDKHDKLGAETIHEMAKEIFNKVKKNYLAGSKVKPVNKKMREALKSVKLFCEQYKVGDEFSAHNLASVMGVERIVESALSTAPDDGVKQRKGYPKINFMAYEPEYALELYKQWLNGEKV